MQDRQSKCGLAHSSLYIWRMGLGGIIHCRDCLEGSNGFAVQCCSPHLPAANTAQTGQMDPQAVLCLAQSCFCLALGKDSSDLKSVRKTR